jgi:hypothetical protein
MQQGQVVVPWDPDYLVDLVVQGEKPEEEIGSRDHGPSKPGRGPLVHPIRRALLPHVAVEDELLDAAAGKEADSLGDLLGYAGVGENRAGITEVQIGKTKAGYHDSS